MTKQQWDAAVQLVRTGKDFSNIDDSPLHGCALPNFAPVTITLECAAKFIQWHCLQINGTFDQEALTELREISRKRWLIC